MLYASNKQNLNFKAQKVWSTYITIKYGNLLQMFLQIGHTPDFEQKFWTKKCGLYAGFYDNNY